MKSKLLRLLLGVLSLFLSMGCSAKSTVEYNNEAKALADSVSARQDQGALDKLIDETKGGDYWQKFYAVVYLGQLLQDKHVINRNNIIKQLAIMIDDDEHTIQREAILGLINAGQDGAVEGIAKLKKLVLTGEDRDVCWFSAQALGLINDQPFVNGAVDVLAQSLLHKTSNESTPDAPQLREYSLESLENISEKNPTLVQNMLLEITPKLDGDYAIKVANLITKLKAKNANSQNHSDLNK